MARPKKVAIIGAGPSGLVMSKTLLHNFPKGTFSPVVFERSHKVGGLWSVDCPLSTAADRGGSRSASPPAAVAESPSPARTTEQQTYSPPRGLIDPFMQTNLSRFSVSFSDLPWEAVVNDEDEIPMFPPAWQVGKYLEKYTERFLARYGVLRLGHDVVSTDREEDTVESGRRRWIVRWIVEKEPGVEENERQCEPDKVESEEQFDFLVVASGNFGSPYIPNIPGLQDVANRTIHSSELQNRDDIRLLLRRSGVSKGKVVVIGGSMSGVEAASALGLYLSDAKFAQDSTVPMEQKFEVYHICSRPFWVVPTYLPHRYLPEDKHNHSRPFLPLDMVLYDLSQRVSSSGDEEDEAVEFGFGPVEPGRILKVNEYFTSLLGQEYRKIGSTGIATDKNGKDMRPSWITISDDYAEYVRSGTVKVSNGRARTLRFDPESSLSTIQIEAPNGQITTILDGVAAIVMATGFSPTESLSFLPKYVLETLGFAKNDHFLPLILDGKGTTHAQFPDLGFVGFYRGAFWGPMEMQAQSLGETWIRGEGPGAASPFSSQELREKAQEREQVQYFRDTDQSSSRGQFPMGDYIGLMETLARQLGRSRLPIPGLSQIPGPVVPVRYRQSGQHNGNDDRETEVQKTMNALRQTVVPDATVPHEGTAAAVFRALHGSWKFSRKAFSPDCGNGENGTMKSGKASFHPRYPTKSYRQKEYVYEEEMEEEGGGEEEEDAKLARAVYALTQNRQTSPHAAQMEVQFLDPGEHSNHQLNIMLTGHEVFDEEKTSRSQYVVYAVEIDGPGSSNQDSRRYKFYFDGVVISKWECTTYVAQPGGLEKRKSRSMVLSKTEYER